MSTIYNDINEKLNSLIDNVHDERFVARAFKSYTENLLVHAKKQIAALSEVIGGDISENANLVTDALSNAGLTGDEMVISTTGEVATLAGVLESIAMGEPDEDNPVLNGTILGTAFSVSGFLDNIVDSYQSAEVYHSAMAALETAVDSVRVSASDIATILEMKGIQLTSRVKTTFLEVTSALNDSSSTIANKIKSLVTLMTKGADAFDQSDVTGIVIPEHSTDFTGASPIVAFLGDIHFDFFPTPQQVVDTVVNTARKVVGGLRWLGKQVAVGFGKLVTVIDKALINPIDFYIINEKAPSNMIDIPAVDKTVHRSTLEQYLEDHIGSNAGYILTEIDDMPVGGLKAAYTPFAIYLLYKPDTDTVRLIKHLIPSEPYVKELVTDSDFAHSIITTYLVDDYGYAWLATDGILNDPSTLFDRYITRNTANKFNSGADDDPYYLSSVASSVHRSYIVERLATLSLVSVDSLQEGDIDVNSTLEENELNVHTGGLRYHEGVQRAHLFGGSIDGTHLSAFAASYFDLPKQDDFIKALRGTVTPSEATNIRFVNTIKFAEDLMENDIVAFLSILFHNNYNVMEDYYAKTGNHIAFIPASLVSQYPEAKYSIATDGKNGSVIGKILLAVGIAAVVIAGGVVAFKAIRSARLALTAEATKLAGLQRAIENSDPNSEDYMGRVANLIKLKRRFNRKNRLLSLVGAGAQTTASSVIAGGNVFEGTLNNNDVIKLINEDVIKLISG